LELKNSSPFVFLSKALLPSHFTAHENDALRVRAHGLYKQTSICQSETIPSPVIGNNECESKKKGEEGERCASEALTKAYFDLCLLICGEECFRDPSSSRRIIEGNDFPELFRLRVSQSVNSPPFKNWSEFHCLLTSGAIGRRVRIRIRRRFKMWAASEEDAEREPYSKRAITSCPNVKEEQVHNVPDLLLRQLPCSLLEIDYPGSERYSGPFLSIGEGDGVATPGCRVRCVTSLTPTQQ
jgi:hypothetical protein